jgi:hypothetical protein
LAFFLFRAADNIDRYAATPSPNHFRAYVAISWLFPTSVMPIYIHNTLGGQNPQQVVLALIKTAAHLLIGTRWICYECTRVCVTIGWRSCNDKLFVGRGLYWPSATSNNTNRPVYQIRFLIKLFSL